MQFNDQEHTKSTPFDSIVDQLSEATAEANLRKTKRLTLNTKTRRRYKQYRKPINVARVINPNRHPKENIPATRGRFCADRDGDNSSENTRLQISDVAEDNTMPNEAEAIKPSTGKRGDTKKVS